MTASPPRRTSRPRNRAEKDDFFAEHPRSPIPPEDRDDFDGLAYFDPDPACRVVTFDFDIDGEAVTLQGYRQAGDDPGQLFVPFWDKTTGQQTYKQGRYMELEHEGELARRGRRGRRANRLATGR